MLHAELDRYWYTWEQSHAGEPALQGADAVFQPLTRREATRYGGGRTYQLAELTGPANLPYRYDTAAGPPTATLRPSAPVLGSPSPAATVAIGSPSISTAGGPVCRLLTS